MQIRCSRLHALLVPVLAATLVAGCDTGSPTGPRFVSLVRVSGSDQAGFIGATVAAPLVVRAVDQNGVPIAGLAIEWEVINGGGSFVSASFSTDNDGYGEAVFRLGNTLGAQGVRAQVGSQSFVIFTLLATPAPASQLRISSGNNQTGTVNAVLAAPLVVFVSDALDNPKAGVAVTFAVVTGSGSLSSATEVTNQAGLASVSWTLGAAAGTQVVTATSTGLAPVTFVATANP
jgi:hypothetical protein